MPERVSTESCLRLPPFKVKAVIPVSTDRLNVDFHDPVRQLIQQAPAAVHRPDGVEKNRPYKLQGGGYMR